METLVIFEAGMRSPEGHYSKFTESPDRKYVEDYMVTMNSCAPRGFELVLYEKTYHCVSTTPIVLDDSNTETD